MSATISGQAAHAAGPRWKYQRHEWRIEHAGSCRGDAGRPTFTASAAMSAIAHPSPVHCGQPPSTHGPANRNRRSGLPREVSRATNPASTGVGGCTYASFPPLVMTPSSNAPSRQALLGQVFCEATALEGPVPAADPGALARFSATARRSIQPREEFSVQVGYHTRIYTAARPTLGAP